jgi:hypothetical protein
MAWSVTVSDGLHDVVLPSGLRVQGGGSAVLSDREFSLLPEASQSSGGIFSAVSQVTS